MAKDAGRDGAGRDDARAERLAAALRDNLRRRKAQARGQKEAPAAANGEDDV